MSAAPDPLLWMTASPNYARFSKFTDLLLKKIYTDSFLLPCISVSVTVNAYHFIPQETEAGGSCKFKVSSGYRTSSLGSLHLVTRCCFKKKSSFQLFITFKEICLHRNGFLTALLWWDFFSYSYAQFFGSNNRRNKVQLVKRKDSRKFGHFMNDNIF